jgi:hypothetical protein
MAGSVTICASAALVSIQAGRLPVPSGAGVKAPDGAEPGEDA